MQQAVIALIVIAAVGYVVWTFMPIARRQQWLDALATHGVLQRAAARHRERLLAGGCAHCASADKHVPVKGGGPSPPPL